MIHEYRIYRCLPGQMPRLLKRFEDHTLNLWKKHGIKQIGFWQVLIGEGNNDLHYIMEWDSLAEREKRWDAFMQDPEWIKARNDSEKAGPIIAEIKTTLLQPTSFSAAR